MLALKEHLQTSYEIKKSSSGRKHNDKTEYIVTLMARLSSSDETFGQNVSNSDTRFFLLKQFVRNFV